jgi:hypothetical protein
MSEWQDRQFAMGSMSLPRFRRHTIPHKSAVGVCHEEANTANIYEGIQG